MRPFVLIILIFFPTLAYASCSEQGASVVYVNGIFTDENKAREDLAALQRKYTSKTKDFDPAFINGYNPSHVQGIGDLIKSIQQAYQDEKSSVVDTDLRTILLQIHPQVTTQKIMLVGHSQGTFYANALYKYLTGKGVPESSVSVYNVATPASYVAGNGGYLTSASDRIINKVRRALQEAPSIESFGAGAALATVEQHQPKMPLSSNIVLALNPEQQASENGGHSFSKVYLAEASDEIIAHIQSKISGLRATASRAGGHCFAAPAENLSYKLGKQSIAGLDFLADQAKLAVSGAGKALAFTRDFALDVAKTLPANIAAGFSKITSDISITAGGVKGLSHAAEPDKTVTNFKIFKALYGSS